MNLAQKTANMPPSTAESIYSNIIASPTVTKKGTACVQHTVNGVHSVKYIFTVLIFGFAMHRAYACFINVAHLVIPFCTKYCKSSG